METSMPIRAAHKAGVMATFAAALAFSLADVCAAALSFDARLIEDECAVRETSATVQVRVAGLEIVDPEAVQEKPRAGQGHRHYRLDEGPVIATTVTRLTFYGLAPGVHRISVTLVGNDHKPLGPMKEFEVSVPIKTVRTDLATDRRGGDET